MCVVAGPNIDIAIKLITRLKNIFERMLGLTFTDNETVLRLNCRIVLTKVQYLQREVKAL
jgi:late competence protein required for DNA uptake (superfamily II DNA/RNA helicase)